VCLQTDVKTAGDAGNGVQRTLLRRCLSHIKYLVAMLLIPPFLNYVALLRESAQLMPSGKNCIMGKNAVVMWRPSCITIQL